VKSADHLYPFDSRYLDLGGISYHYLDEGQGDPVVMLHGNPTWSFFFRDLVRGLRDSCRAVVPDHVGCGLSDKPRDARYDYTLSRRVADLEALLDHLRLTSGLTLVLHDWGGMIGMAFAHRHPERIRRLVVLNTACFRPPAGKHLPWSLRLCRAPLLGPLLVRGLGVFSAAAVRWCAARPLPPEVRAAYRAPYDSWANRLAVLRFLQDIPTKPGDRAYEVLTQVEEGLARFADLPVLICWGGRDFVFDADFLAGWRERFPRAEVHSFPDAGHFVLEDAGAEIVSLVRDFLTRS
jgi:haloalkane dehalogenase